jgi:hypothetical protein
MQTAGFCVSVGLLDPLGRGPITGQTIGVGGSRERRELRVGEEPGD